MRRCSRSVSLHGPQSRVPRLHPLGVRHVSRGTGRGEAEVSGSVLSPGDGVAIQLF